MRVAFDHQAFCRRPYTGISRYFVRLFEHLAQVDDLESRIFAPLHVNRLLAASPAGGAAGYHLSRHPRPARPIIRAVSGELARRRIVRWRPDLVHETYYAFRPSAPRDTPVVLTIHDLIHERFPEQFPFYDRALQAKKAAIARADHFLCVSHATARDLQSFHGVAMERISVIYHGVDQADTRHLALRQDAGGIDRGMPFLLYVGERGGYKNFETFIHAYAASTSLRADVRILCCGGGEFSSGERRLLKALGVIENVRYTLASDDLLRGLYAQAAAYVCPSRCEGFGLPLLEAMVQGCPVLASRAGSLPEVAGDAARYFDPTDLESLRAALELLVDSASQREELRQKGYQRASRFSWSRCAQETQAVYRRIVG